MDSPVKLLTALSQSCPIASANVSKKLVNAIKNGYDIAKTKYENLNRTDPLQHWIDMYTAVANEVMDINDMLKEKYRTTNLENYNKCDRKIADFAAFSNSVLEQLNQEMPRQNAKEMANIVFNAIKPLTEGKYCCNDPNNPHSPALEVRILALPDMLNRHPISEPESAFSNEPKPHEESLSLEETGYRRVNPTKGSPAADRFRGKVRERSPERNANSSCNAANLRTTVGSHQPRQDTPTAYSTSTRPVSSTNMLGAAKRYASKSQDRHRSGAKPLGSPGKRSALPGQGILITSEL